MRAAGAGGLSLSGAGRASAVRPHPVTLRACARGRVSTARWLAPPARVRAPRTGVGEWREDIGSAFAAPNSPTPRGIAPRGGCLTRAVSCRAPARACACAGSRRARRPSPSPSPARGPVRSAACLRWCRRLNSGRTRRPVPRPWRLPRRWRRTVRVGARRGARRGVLAALARLKVSPVALRVSHGGARLG